MNTHHMREPHLAQSLRAGQAAIASLRAAGIDSDDPDFEILLASESDALELIAKMFRASQIAKEEAKACRAYAEQVIARAERKSAKAETLRTIVLQGMTELGMKKLERPDFTLSVLAGPVSVRGEADPDLLPEAFVRVKRELNKSAIKAALQAGEEVPGFTLSNGAAYLKASV